MKKILSLVLAVLLIVSLLPMTVLAEAPAEVIIRCFPAAEDDFSLTFTAGNVHYLVATEANDIAKWTGTEAPTDNFVKFEYVVEGDKAVMKVTFQNFVVDTTAADSYSARTIAFQDGEYDIEIELVGKNAMSNGKAPCIYARNTGNVTITGAGTMDLALYNQGPATMWMDGKGDLIIKNTTINFNVEPGRNAKHHAILSSQGNVIIENTKITANLNGGWSLVWLGANSGSRCRLDMDTNTDRYIAVKNCEMDIKVAAGGAFVSASPARISNSTITVSKSVEGNDPIFLPAPTFEGDYTVIAGLAKNADDFSKMKVYQESKLGSYTFVHAVPGIVDLLPTEPEVTIPETTVPETTVPEITVPETTVPEVTQPATQPNATEPNATEPNATEPNASESADTTDGEEGGNPLVTVVIIIGVLVVLAGGGVAALFILKKKGIIK